MPPARLCDGSAGDFAFAPGGGVLLRLGLFGNKKSLSWAFAIIVFADTMLGISTSMAAYGATTYTNSITNAIYGLMTARGAGEMTAGVVSYVAAGIVDKGLMLGGTGPAEKYAQTGIVTSSVSLVSI